MNLLLFTTSHWSSPDEAMRLKPELEAWQRRAREFFGPMRVVIGTGSAGTSATSPLPGAVVVQSYAPPNLHHDPAFCDYWSCAFSAGCFAAMQLYGWNLMVVMEPDVIIGEFDRNLLSQFAARAEILMAPHWRGQVETNFMVLKPEGVARYIHFRVRPNINLTNKPAPIGEEELAMIFRGRWWNPWPSRQIRQDFAYPDERPDTDMRGSPLIRLPSPTLREHYATTTRH